MGSFNQAGLFLVTVIFSLYVWVLLLRLILHKLRADYFNPLSQTVIRATQFIVKPLKKVFRDIAGFETATVIIVLLVGLIKLLLIYGLYGAFPNPVVLGVQLIGDTLHQLLNLYFYLLIINAIASWFMGAQNNPVLMTLNRIVEPLLRPFRRIIPPLGGIDITPLVALLIIKAIDIALIMPLMRI